MARQNIVRAFDDIERKRDPNSQAQAHRKVVVEVKVYDLDDNYLANESLETREADVSSANLDSLKDGVRPAWNVGQRPKAPANTGRSSGSSGRRSSGNSGGSGRSTNSVSGQRAEFNKAVRAWAKTQPEYSELRDQGRIPGHVVAAFQAHRPDWAQEYFKGNPPEDLANRSSGGQDSSAPSAPAPEPEQPVSDTEPAPEQVSEPADQDEDFDEDDQPSVAETDDRDWGYAEAPTGFTGSPA